MAIRGIIFDMDGTLVDSKLDFDAMRRDMGFPPGAFILEALEKVPPGAHREELLRILRRHEEQGALAAEPMPGLQEFLDELTRRSVRTGILTRNSRESTDLTLKRFAWPFDPVLTRDDAPAKPSPVGLQTICRAWNLHVDELLFFGDFTLDLDAGRNAGIRTVLYAPGARPDFADDADFVISHYNQAAALLDRLG